MNEGGIDLIKVLVILSLLIIVFFPLFRAGYEVYSKPIIEQKRAFNTLNETEYCNIYISSCKCDVVSRSYVSESGMYIVTIGYDNCIKPRG